MNISRISWLVALAVGALVCWGCEGTHPQTDQQKAKQQPKETNQSQSEQANICRVLVDQAMIIEHWMALEKDVLLRKNLIADFASDGYSYSFIKLGPNGQHIVEFTPAGKGMTDSDNAEQIGRELNIFEEGVLLKFLKAKGTFVERFTDNGAKYEYYQPIYAKDKSCIICHNAINSPGGFGGVGIGALEENVLKKGDLMAIIKISRPVPSSR